ncbi:MAG: hypothetical protein ACHQQR_08670 [Gemmatimonadales bacterium]|jgi:hypothetical protein
MNVRELTSTTAVRVALGALVVAAAVAVWALRGAIRTDVAPSSDPRAASTTFVLPPPSSGGPTDVRAAVAHDIFAADRQAPTERYRAPGDEEVATKKNEVTPSRPVVLGTATSASAPAFAVARLGSERPSIVHVGEKVGDYTVLTIDRSHVVFVAPSGEKFDIQPSKPELSSQQPSLDANVETPTNPRRRRGRP